MKTKTRSRRSTKPVPGPAAIGLTDQQMIKRLPLFGPGLPIRIPLHLWPTYRDANRLEELPPQLPPHERIKQSVLLVRRTGAEPESTQDLWRCMNCDGQPELLHRAMMQHMREVHEIDTQTAVGTKTMIMHLDGAGFYHSTFEYVIDGLIFRRFQNRKKNKS